MLTRLTRYIESLSPSEFCIFLARYAVVVGIMTAVVAAVTKDPAAKWIAYGCFVAVVICVAVGIRYDRIAARKRAEGTDGTADENL